MKRLTEQRDGQNVIPLRQNGKIKWAICSAGMGDAPTEYLYGDHADRLAAIEDILGDEYELDRLRELVEADREGRRIPRGYVLVKMETLEELEQQAALKAREQDD